MNKRAVYLAGPMKGLSYKQAAEWRNYIANNIREDIECLNPFRGKTYLSNEIILKPIYDTYALSNSKAITTRDRFDAQRCDVLLVNFLEAKDVSIGTCMEIAWADSVRTPIVLVMEKEGNPHDHPMITECAGFRVDSLDDAIELINNIL